MVTTIAGPATSTRTRTGGSSCLADQSTTAFVAASETASATSSSCSPSKPSSRATASTSPQITPTHEGRAEYWARKRGTELRSTCASVLPALSDAASGQELRRSPTLSMEQSSWRASFAVHRTRLEDEDLNREVGIDVVVAHEADHLAAGELLDLAADVGLHHRLPASAQIEHCPALARVAERPLSV